MIRLQSVLVILVIIAVVIWGVRTVASDDPEATPSPTEIAHQHTMVMPTATSTGESATTILQPTFTPK